MRVMAFFQESVFNSNHFPGAYTNGGVYNKLGSHELFCHVGKNTC